MKQLVWGLAIFSTLGLAACNQTIFSQHDSLSADSSPIAPSPSLELSASPDSSSQVATFVAVDEFTLDEIESVAIDAGTLRVKRNTETIELPVVGDAGC